MSLFWLCYGFCSLLWWSVNAFEGGTSAQRTEDRGELS